ncbi:MAG: hypothetical protein ACC645_25025 [Pirellulales bacterium]
MPYVLPEPIPFGAGDTFRLDALARDGAAPNQPESPGDGWRMAGLRVRSADKDTRAGSIDLRAQPESPPPRPYDAFRTAAPSEPSYVIAGGSGADLFTVDTITRPDGTRAARVRPTDPGSLEEGEPYTLRLVYYDAQGAWTRRHFVTIEVTPETYLEDVTAERLARARERVVTRSRTPGHTTWTTYAERGTERLGEYVTVDLGRPAVVTVTGIDDAQFEWPIRLLNTSVAAGDGGGSADIAITDFTVDPTDVSLSTLRIDYTVTPDITGGFQVGIFRSENGVDTVGPALAAVPIPRLARAGSHSPSLSKIGSAQDMPVRCRSG